MKIQSNKLKTAFGVLDVLVEEARIDISKDGWKIVCVDGAHVAMANVAIPADQFIEPPDADMSIGIDITKMNDILKLAGKDEEITFVVDGDKSSINVGIGNLKRSMKYPSPDSMNTPKTPTLTLPATIVVNIDKLSIGVKCAGLITDHVLISASPDGFSMSAKGDTDRMELSVPKEDISKLETDGEYKSLYSLNYVTDMFKQMAGEITVHLGNDFPLMIDFTTNGIVCKFILAPRIEND